jgi:hypothetical protein
VRFLNHLSCLNFEIDVERLRMQVFLDGFKSSLTTVPALLPATPGCLFAGEVRAVDRNGADFKVRRDPQATRNVGREYDACFYVNKDCIFPPSGLNLPESP